MPLGQLRVRNFDAERGGYLGAVGSGGRPMGLRNAMAITVLAACIGLAGCGSRGMVELQRDAVIEAAGTTKEEQERFDREKRRLADLERRQTEQEIAEGKKKSRRMAEAEELKRLQDEQLRQELAENQAKSKKRILVTDTKGGEGGGGGGGGGD